MPITTLFTTNRSQAVRLPKAAAFPETVKQVEIVVVNDARIITPVGKSWDTWFDGPGVPEDFLQERDQPHDQIREAF